MGKDSFLEKRICSIKESLLWPARELKALKRLWRLMGNKGLFWYMAIQGRWNIRLTMALSVLSLVILFGLLLAVVRSGTPWWSWGAIAFGVILAGWMHYILWRCTAHSKGNWRILIYRLYAVPILSLLIIIIVGLGLVGIEHGVLFIGNLL